MNAIPLSEYLWCDQRTLPLVLAQAQSALCSRLCERPAEVFPKSCSRLGKSENKTVLTSEAAAQFRLIMSPPQFYFVKLTVSLYLLDIPQSH